MKPRKVKEDDAPRTIACPHKVSAVFYFLHHFVQYLAKDRLNTRKKLAQTLSIIKITENMYVMITISELKRLSC